jgi:lysophospholipase L1-like esterase
MNSGNVLWLPLLLMGLGLLQAGRCPAADYLQLRNGLPHCHGNFTSGRHMNAIFIGSPVSGGAGAGTAGAGYQQQTWRNLRELFPGASVGQPAVTGGRGSWWAAHSAAQGQAVYGTHLPGSVMFVETATDDEGQPPAQIIAALEGLIRQVWARASMTDIVFLYGLRREHLADYQAGKVPAVIQCYEQVAAHYGLPSLNLGRLVADKIAAGELTWETFSPDGQNPGDRGHALYAQAVKELLTAAKQAAPAGQPPPQRVLPEPLSPAPLTKAHLLPYEATELSGPWQVGRPSPLPLFRHALVADQPAAVLTVRFKGAGAGLFCTVGPDSGDVETSLNGGPWQLQRLYDPAVTEAPQPRALPLVAGLDPAQSHELRLRPAAAKPAGSQGQTLRVGCLLINGEVKNPYEGLSPLERIDAIYAAMDPLVYTPPAGRWQLIPKTMQRLREGGELKIVLLGDSIMNQTTHSGFPLLLQRQYPNVKITAIASVRGSTGCWWYKDENRVQEYVLKHQPDLLMIGGISQRNDVASIREVIRQVRAQQQPEIMLLTPAFGFEGSEFIKNWTYDIAPGATDYRGQLRDLATELQCEFLDMTGPWWQYVQASGKTYGWFRGDAVHANERGSQILARILEKYFAPQP